jgi:soluble lytic murein transglycosylase-like protein
MTPRLLAPFAVPAWRFASRALLLTSFALAAHAAAVMPEVAPPEWSDEPPMLSRWIEEGWAAQQAKDPLKAAARYCDAARFGSTEAQYRLGLVFLDRPDDEGPRLARNMLAVAAQRGHEKAQATLAALSQQGLQRLPPGPDLPDCLLTGAAPQFAVRPAQNDYATWVVPHEVVERYMLALPQDKRRHALMIQRLAPRFDVDFRLALAIARAESNFDAAAVSPKNAQGLMQLIPDTATRFGVRNAFDPEQNVRGGLAYLRWLLERFGGDVALASAAYNAGEGAVDRHGGIPPYNETRNYVQRILNFYRAPMHQPPTASVGPQLPQLPQLR